MLQGVILQLSNLTLSVPGLSSSGVEKVAGALEALGEQARTKLELLAQRLSKHQEERPSYLTRDLEEEILAVKTVYPTQHPNYSLLWPDMVTRLQREGEGGSRLKQHQVKLGELWIRERQHLEAQVRAARGDITREVHRVEQGLRKVKDNTNAYQIKISHLSSVLNIQNYLLGCCLVV